MERNSEVQVYAQIAEAVRDELIRAAIEGYEAGALDGLCASGATEAAISAMRRVDLSAIVKRLMHHEE